MIRQMEVGGGAGKEFPGTSHGACGVVVTSQNGIMVAFKLLLCGVNNSYDVQVKEVKDVPSSDESSKGMEVKYLGAYIVGLRITCSYSNNGIEVFDGQSSFSWEEKKSAPCI